MKNQLSKSKNRLTNFFCSVTTRVFRVNLYNNSHYNGNYKTYDGHDQRTFIEAILKSVLAVTKRLAVKM